MAPFNTIIQCDSSLVALRNATVQCDNSVVALCNTTIC